MNIDQIKALAEKVATITYQRSFSEAELSAMASNLSDLIIEIDRHNEHFEALKKEHGELIKPKKAQVKELLKNLRMKFSEETVEAYQVLNEQSMEMEYYDMLGNLVHSRRLLPHERPQIPMFKIGDASNGN